MAKDDAGGEGRPPWRADGDTLPAFASLAGDRPPGTLDAEELYEAVRKLLRHGKPARAQALASRHLQSPSASGTAWAVLATLILRTGGDIDVAAGFFARSARLPGWRRQHLSPAGSIITAAAFRALGDAGALIATNPIAFGPRPATGGPVLVTSADPVYFEAFAEAYVRSARRVAGDRLGVHIHLFDPGELLWETVTSRCRRPGDPFFGVGFSREHTGDARRGYFYVGRFIQLGSIMDFHGATCIVTDIDCVFLRDPTAVIEAAGDADFGLCYFDRYVFPWQNFRANMMLARNSPEGRRGLASLRAFLGSMPPDTSRFYYVDQVGLMMLHHAGFSSRWITAAYKEVCFQSSGAGADLNDKVRRTMDALRKANIDL